MSCILTCKLNSNWFHFEGKGLNKWSCLNLRTFWGPLCHIWSQLLSSGSVEACRGFCRGVTLTLLTVVRIHGEKLPYKNCWTVSLWEMLGSSWTWLEVFSHQPAVASLKRAGVLSDGIQQLCKKNLKKHITSAESSRDVWRRCRSFSSTRSTIFIMTQQNESKIKTSAVTVLHCTEATLQERRQTPAEGLVDSL